MKHRKSLVIGVVVIFLVIILFSMNTYTSSPGFTSKEGMEEFFANKPTCHGIDILLNEKATWADAAGRSLCIGYLKYNEVSTTNPNSELTTESLDAIQEQLDRRNKRQDFPVYPEEHTPSIVGIYDGMNIVEQYWCSDVCPDNGILYLNIASSTEQSCKQLGGNKLYKWGWGLQYVGCSPTENKYSD